MLDRGLPVHVVTAWHGHSPEMSLAVYADAKADELRAAGGSLFG
ncbi:MAG: recombinase XerD [Rhodococcus sp. (in: high G+C Gram-positive bacteria)]